MRVLKEILDCHKEFTKERDWDQFLSPKNVSMALSKETSELIEIFTWITEKQSKNLDQKTLQNVKDEIADVFLYLIRLSDLLDIDIIQASKDKMVKNIEKHDILKSLENTKSLKDFNKD